MAPPGILGGRREDLRGADHAVPFQIMTAPDLVGGDAERGGRAGDGVEAAVRVDRLAGRPRLSGRCDRRFVPLTMAQRSWSGRTMAGRRCRRPAGWPTGTARATRWCRSSRARSCPPRPCRTMRSGRRHRPGPAWNRARWPSPPTGRPKDWGRASCRPCMVEACPVLSTTAQNVRGRARDRGVRDRAGRGRGRPDWRRAAARVGRRRPRSTSRSRRRCSRDPSRRRSTHRGPEVQVMAGSTGAVTGPVGRSREVHRGVRPGGSVPRHRSPRTRRRRSARPRGAPLRRRRRRCPTGTTAR